MVADISFILSDVGNAFLAHVWNIVAAIILLVIGLVVGKIVGRVVKEVLLRIKIDYYVTEMHKPPISLADIFSVITRWYIYIATIGIALSSEVLGVVMPGIWIKMIQEFIPGIIGAAAVITAGYLVGEYIKTQLRKTGKPYSALAGKVILFFTLYVSIALALPLLGLNAELVKDILLIMAGAVGVAFALAFGLGGKEVVADILKRWVRKTKL